jgi:hypothetical protein
MRAETYPRKDNSRQRNGEQNPRNTSSGTATYIPVFTDSSGDIGNSTIYQSNPGNYVIAATAGGAVLNASNFLDQDMQVVLTPHGGCTGLSSSCPVVGDKHALIGPSTNTNLTLGVGGTEMMRINNAGNVGIGYSNPQQRLVIGAPLGGTVLNATNLQDQDLNVIVTAPRASTKYTYFGPSVATNLALGVGLSTKVWITNAGNVGIGTTTPAAMLDVNGAVNAATSYNLGGSRFAFGSILNGNAFLGFAGNTTSRGGTNTASGVDALASNTTGNYNTASGGGALVSNTTGADNTASGSEALYSNTTGNYNTASGYQALFYNTTGVDNTAAGFGAGITADSSFVTGSYNTAVGTDAFFSTGSLNNATAIGASAVVAESNALVLGSIKGVNAAPASVSVGIGTTAPAATLDVRDNGSGGNTISATSAAVNDAVYGINTSTAGLANGAAFYTASPAGSAVVGVNTGSGGNDYAGYFQGNVAITGNLSKGGGSFKIDHPLDPANKYLYHSFVESPDMMNVYNGNVVTNQRGVATVTLPDYFEALNQDFRYQLTVIGQFAQAIVAKKIGHNRFVIRTSKPNVEVSWQVTGIRHDAYADAHRIQVEVEKPPQEQGRYLHPELFGAPAEEAIGYQAPPLPTKASAQDETAHVSSLKTPPTSLR